MKKLLLLTALTVGLLSAKAAATSTPYTIDDQQVEQMFANSTDITLTAVPGDETPASNWVLNTNNPDATKGAAFSQASDKSFVAALLLDLFLGGLGIHRLYLGTKTFTWVGYILTCGGIFGIVPLVDLIVLIVHSDDISPYVNNPKFFMWSGGNM